MNKQYEDIHIPKELKIMTNNTIKKKNNNKKIWQSLSAVAAALIIFTTSVNVSPAFAESLSSIPVISNIASLLTFTSYETQTDELAGNVTKPNITIEDSIDTFINDIIDEQVQLILIEAQINAEEYKEAYLDTGGTEAGYLEKNMSVTVDYEIYSQNEDYLSFRVYSHESLAAVYASNLYFTVDLKDKSIVTLKTLLGDNYLETITENVLEAIKEDASINPNKYFEDYSVTELIIREDINFYINNNHQLMVVFEKYELAAGVFGRLEFEIPMK